MPADVIEVIDGGFFTTVQDLGRYGYQRYGVPVSGAMDLFALRAANLLTGTDEGAAALEMTLQGPRLRFVSDTVIALTGADLDPRVDGWPVPMWRATAVAEGAVLSFGGPRIGLRTYLAVAGGIEVPLVLGSRSTFTASGLGGFEGRPLQSLDRLATATLPAHPIHGRTIAAADVPTYGPEHVIRIMLGPQDDAFTRRGIETFLSAEYVISQRSDRIGCRLEGPPIEHRAGADIVSDGTPFGAVQVSGDGLPIILMADRGTTGGYTKIATVISVDLLHLAQALPGDRIRFRAVSMEEALGALRRQEAALDRVKESPGITFARRHFSVSVDGTPCGVTTGFTPQDDESASAALVSSGEVAIVRRPDGRAVTARVEIASVAAGPDC